MPRPGECSDRDVFTRDVQYYLLLLARIALPMEDVHVTRLADHRGFASSCRYEPFLRGIGTWCFDVQGRMREDMVDLNIRG